MMQKLREFLGDMRQEFNNILSQFHGRYYRILKWMWKHPDVNRQIQSVIGLATLLLLAVFLLRFPFIGNRLNAVPVDVAARVNQLLDSNPLIARVPLPFLEFFIVLFHASTFRYLVPPLLTFLLVCFVGARFVQDVFDLNTIWQGFHHMLSAMLGLLYPRVLVDGGEVKVEDRSDNLLTSAGGPGYVLIQPGNVVQFRQLRELTNHSDAKSYFLSHFETIELPISLEDQVGRTPSAIFETRDGIRVRFSDIIYGYRILPEDENFRRSPSQPYSYDADALQYYLFDRSVGDEGLRDWQGNISFALDGPIRSFVNENSIDFLMSPGIDDQEVRRVIRERVMAAQPLERYGAELLWIDIGAIDLVDFKTEINGKRLERWQADWRGDAEVTRAYGEATRRVFLEIGRAEAQAEAIKSIVQSLESIEWQEDAVSNLRKVLLSRTAQFLETILEKNPEKMDCETRTSSENGPGA